jgi:hypothetical protein
MMKYRFFALFLAMGISQFVFAQEDGDDKDNSNMIKSYISNGPGVYTVKEKGRIFSIFIVSQVEIPTALGKTKGILFASNKADIDCSAKLTKWLEENVTGVELDEDGTVFLEERNQKNDEDSLNKKSTSIRGQSIKTATAFKSIVRGLEVVATEINADLNIYTRVKVYIPSNQKSIKKLREDLNSNETTGNKTNKGDFNSDKRKKTSIDEKIESKSTMVPNIGDFFPKKNKQ